MNDDRLGGFEDTIAEIAPEIEIIAEVASDFTREAGLADMTDALTAYPEIDAVFSLDDETSIGALQAIDESGRTDVKVITGGGGCQEYFNMMPEYENIWVCSATYSPDMITHCVENVAKILAGEEVEHNVVIPTTIVDRDNVEEFLNPIRRIKMDEKHARARFGGRGLNGTPGRTRAPICQAPKG